MNQSMEEFLLTTLQNAANQSDINKVKEGERNLALFETEPNFYTALLNVYLNRQLDFSIRYIAILQFKNGIDRFWRKTQQNAIPQEEKIQLKKRLLESDVIKEPIDQLLVQLTVVISKIARLDCPEDWEELMPRILQLVNSTDEFEQKRSLQILVQVVKALSSRRLHHDRLIFEECASNLYEFVANLWNGFTLIYFQNVQAVSQPQVCENFLTKATLALKILRKLTIHGFHKPQHCRKPQEFLTAVFERIKDLLECRLLIKSWQSPSLLESHEKFILKHLKILVEFQDYHRVAFITFAPKVLEMSFNYAFSEGSRLIFEGNQLTLPKFVIHCLNLIKGYLLNNNGNIYSSTNETDSNLTDVLKNFFTDERLEYIIEKLLSHYFLLTPDDLENWESDPESYVGDEGGDSWKYNLRSCTEAFFMALFHKYHPTLCQHLKIYVEKSQTIQLSELSEAQDILIKESIYNAVGLVAFHLFDDIDFDALFTNVLLRELQLQEPKFKVLRKRIIWMIGQWSGVKFSQSLKPTLYEACLKLLQPSEDMVVRLTAAKTLKIVLDDFDFRAEQFLEFLEPSFTILFHLLKEAKECDTKMNVLYVMSFIVEKMSMSIKIQADNLVAYLPLLWDEGIEHNMLRIAIISALVQIIKAIDELPESVTPFIYQVINISTNVNDPSTVFLMEEGLELWLVVVQYSPQPNDTLIKLCDNLLPIIEKSTLNLKTCLLIMNAYILLCPELYLQKYGTEIVNQCQYLMKDIRTEGIIPICYMFITMIKVQPNYAIQLLHSVMVDIVRNLLHDTDYMATKQIYLQVAVRYFLANNQAFSAILAETNVENSFQKFLTIWMQTMPNITQNEDKKLLALGLCSLLTIPNETIYESFSAIIVNVYETLCDIMRQETEDGEEVDSCILNEHADLDSMYFSDDAYEYKTHHHDRYRKMCFTDAVYKVVLKDYLQSQLIALKQQVGDEKYTFMVNTIDLTIHRLLFNYVNTMVVPGGLKSE